MTPVSQAESTGSGYETATLEDLFVELVSFIKLLDLLETTDPRFRWKQRNVASFTRVSSTSPSSSQRSLSQFDQELCFQQSCFSFNSILLFFLSGSSQ